ncbi:hypothetical protein F4801DRAFT_584162 [Xylaria longipes]|nr:hypothetical protein F4801DRAFT_584162 [Xylaria longipes]
MNIDPLRSVFESQSQQKPSFAKPEPGINSEGNDPNHHQGGFHRVIKGPSFVDENYTMGSRSFSSDPHGTQMMNLICAIDPCCENHPVCAVHAVPGNTAPRAE